MGEEFLKMMEGMKINIAVQVDGKISSTNASYVDGSNITLFQMDFGEMMKDKESFKEFKNKEPKNIEEMKKFLEKFPGMKIEVEKPISVKFK
jgi:Cu/Ag efflux pump CusA